MCYNEFGCLLLSNNAEFTSPEPLSAVKIIGPPAREVVGSYLLE